MASLAKWKTSAAALELFKLVENNWFRMDYSAYSVRFREKSKCPCWPNIKLLIEAAALLALYVDGNNDNTDEDTVVTTIEFMWIGQHTDGPFSTLYESFEWYVQNERQVKTDLKRICSMHHKGSSSLKLSQGATKDKLLWTVTAKCDKNCTKEAVNIGEFLGETIYKAPVYFPSGSSYDLLWSSFGPSVPIRVTDKDWILLQMDTGASNLNIAADDVQLTFDSPTPPSVIIPSELLIVPEEENVVLAFDNNSSSSHYYNEVSTSTGAISTGAAADDNYDNSSTAFPLIPTNKLFPSFVINQLAVSETLSKHLMTTIDNNTSIKNYRILNDCPFDGCLQLCDLKANSVLISIPEGYIRLGQTLQDLSQGGLLLLAVPIYELPHGNAAIEIFQVGQNNATLTAEISLYHAKNRMSQMCAGDLLRMEIVDPVDDNDNLVVLNGGHLKTDNDKLAPLNHEILFEVYATKDMDAAGSACIVLGTEFLKELKADMLFFPSWPKGDSMIAGILTFDATCLVSDVLSPSLRF